MNNRRGRKFHASDGGRVAFDRTDSLPVKLAPKVATAVYLDLPHDFEADPEQMLIWLDQMREHCRMTYNSNISKIFGSDGMIGDYPKLERPTPPREDSEEAWDRWTVLDSIILEERYTLDNDRVRFMAYLSRQMSETSKYSISWTMLGARAMKENDPRDLISAVVITHTSGRRGTDLLCIMKAEKAFLLHAMQPGEALAHHFSRFRMLFSALKLEHLNANKPMREYSESYLSMHFLRGLNSDYVDYMRLLMCELKKWPLTLEDAYAEAAGWLPNRGETEQHALNAERRNGQIQTSRGGRGGGRIGQQGGRGTGQRAISSSASTPYAYGGRAPPAAAAAATRHGSRPGQCHACGEEGHHAFECHR